MIPRKSATVHSEILNDEVCVYEWTTKEVHVLNSTAARIWRLCDGRTSVREIARPLAAELGIRDAEAVVWLALRDFREKGLIESGLAMPDDRALSRRQLIARLGVAAAALPVIRSIVAPTALQAASAGTQTFNFTGAAQTFFVPGGVTAITIDAYGAQSGGTQVGTSRLPGASGGRVQATLIVSPGDRLTVNVGGQGGEAPRDGLRNGAGGFNGGGKGGRFGGGGGGASDLIRNGTTLLVAGGGGGAGGAGTYNSVTMLAAAGGAGGGLIGQDGGEVSAEFRGHAGGGGTQTAGGAGGAAGPDSSSGMSGTAGIGGAGAGAEFALFPVQLCWSNGGGGGGGGYDGGGGGGAGFDGCFPSGGSLPTRPAGGGGGGGSSCTDPAATNVTHTTGARSGDGLITISW